MSDIWSGIGVDIAGSSSGEWLYRTGEEVRGPIPFEAVVSKLLAGELDTNTLVAREGGEFHPIVRVAVFAPHVKQASERAAAKAARKLRRLVTLVVLIALAGAAGGGFFFWKELERRRAEAEALRQQREEELARKRAELEAMPKMGLVALVSLGTEDEVKIRNQPAPSATPASKKSGKLSRKERGAAQPAPAAEEEMVQSCKLSQQDIFGTLKKHLAKINVCVEDEKTRDAANLPPQLELEFVVKPNGKVTDFEVNNRHYRTGPMKNCMVKAFNTITFPESSGTNCPVTIPIRIGK